MDITGAFITKEQSQAYHEMKDDFGSVIPNLFRNDAINFLSTHSSSDLQIKRGDNNLETCIQF